MTQEVLARLGIDAGPIDAMVLDYLEYFKVPLHPKQANRLNVMPCLGALFPGN